MITVNQHLCSKRVEELESYFIQLIENKELFNQLCDLASMICETPIAIISILTDTKRLIISGKGISIKSTSLESSSCLAALQSNQEIYCIEDLDSYDPLNKELYTEEIPRVRFYAGIPLINRNGIALGTLSVYDTKPRVLSSEQKNGLIKLASQTLNLLESHRNEIAFQNSKKEFESKLNSASDVIEASQVGTWEWHLQTGELIINERWAQIAGYTREELQPVTIDTWYKLLFHEDRPLSDEKLQDCFDNRKEFYDIECRLIHKDGSHVWINDRGRVVSRTSDGKPLIMAGTDIDITERKKSESQFKIITDNLPGVVVRYKLFDNGTDLLEIVSQGALDLWGVAAEDAIKDNSLIWKCYDKRDLEEHRKSIQKSAETMELWQHEWRYLHPKNGMRWHKGVGKPIRYDDKSIIWDSLILDITEEKEAKIALEENEKRFEQLFDKVTNLSVQGYDSDGYVKFWNKASEELYGYSKNEALGKKLWDLIIPEHMKKGVQASVNTMIANGEGSPAEELLLQTKDGRLIPVYSNHTVLKMHNKTEELFCIDIDLREKKKTEEELIRKEKLYRSLVENGADAIVILGIDGNTKYVSPSITKVLGYTEEEAMQLNLFDVVHPDDVEGVSKRMEELLKSPGSSLQGYTSRTLHKDGSWRWLEATITNLLHDPIVNGIVDNFRDVTDKIESEIKIKASEEKYRMLFNSSPNPKWIMELDTFKVIDANPSFTGYYGYHSHELIDLDVSQLFENNDASILTQKLTESSEYDDNYDFGVTKNVKKDGTLMLMDLSGHKIKLENKNCILIAGNDVTEKEKAFEKLRENEHKLKRAQQIAKLGYWQINPDNSNLFWSEEVYNIWELDKNAETLDYEYFLSSIHPEDLDRVKQAIQEAIRSKKTLNEEHRIVLKKGKVKWVQQSGGFEEQKETNQIYFQGTVQDITHRKMNELWLILMGDVIKNMNESVIIIDAGETYFQENKIIYINNGCTQLSGYNLTEVLDQNSKIIFGDSLNSIKEIELQKIIAEKGLYETTKLSKRKNGEEYWSNITISPIADAYHKIHHWVIIMRDVTLQKIKEIESGLMTEISSFFNKNKNLKTSLEALSQHICELLDVSFAEVWIPNSEKTHVNLLANYASNSEGKTFYRLNRNINQFTNGEGLPGSIWKNKKIEFWNNLKENKLFVRRDGAIESNLNAAVGIPLSHAGEIKGILLIGTSDSGVKLRKYQSIFNQFEGYIGAEIARKKLETELNQVISFAPGIICILNNKAEIKQLNEMGIELFGYNENEIIGKSLTDFIYPDDQNLVSTSISNFHSNKETKSFEVRFLNKNGKLIWLNWTIRYIPENEELYGVAKDVSQNRELADLLEAATTLAKIGSWEIDVKNKGVYWSKITREIHEVLPDYLPSDQNAVSFYQEPYQAQLIELITNCILNGDKFDFEAPISTAKGNTCWVRIIGKAEFRNSECIRVYGSLQDIHLRKEAEIRLKWITNNIPGVVFQYELNPDGIDKLAYVSKGSIQIWGLEPEDCMRDTSLVWKQIEAGGSEEIMKSSVLKSAKNLSKWNIEFRSIQPNGKVLWLEGNGFPRKLPDGTIIWDALITDITEKVELKHLLERSSKMALVGTWEYTMNGSDLLYLSPIMREVIGAKEDQIFSLSEFYKLFDPSSKVKIKCAVEDLLSVSNEFDLELVVHNADGKGKWVRCIGQSESIDNAVHKIFGSFQDIHTRKIAELNLTSSLKSLEDYKFALDQSAIIAITNNKGVITSINQNFCAISQFSEVELIGKTHKLINSGHHPKEFFKDLWSTILSGKVWRGEIKNKAKDGSLYWVDTTIVPFHNSENELTQFLAIRFDVTSRKLAEEKLLESYMDKNTILESIGDGFFAIDRNWVVTYWNPQAELILLKSKDEAVGMHLKELYPDSSIISFFEHYERAMKTSVKTIFEEYYSSLKIWLEVSVYPSENGLSIYFKDITKRKQVEQELLIFKMVIENSKDGIAIADANGDAIYLNPEFSNLLGHNSDSLNAQGKPGLVYANQEIAAEVFGTLLGGNHWKGDIEIINAEGSNSSFLLSGGPIFNENKALIAIYGIHTDISERKLAERQIHEKASQLRAISNINSELLNYDDWNKVLNKSFALIADVLNIDDVFYYKNFIGISPNTSYMTRKLHWTKNNENKAGINLPDKIVFTEESELIQILQRNKPVLSNSKDQQPLFWTNLHNPTLALPIFVHKSFWGMIGLSGYASDRVWKEEEITFVQTIITNFSTAIETYETGKQLQESFVEKNQILESIGDGFCAISRDWQITYWNQQAEEMFRFEKKKIIGKSIWEYFPNLRTDFPFQYFKHAMENGQKNSFEYFHTKNDKWFDIGIYPSSYGISIFFRNITSRKLAEEQIKQSNERFEKVSEATNDAIWDWDIIDNTLFWGNGFRTLFGYDLEKHDGSINNWTDNVHPDDGKQMLDSLIDTIENKNTINWEHEYRFKRLDGSYAYVMDRGVVIRNQKGVGIRMVGAMTDMTPQKEYEDSLRNLYDQLAQHTKELAASNAELEQFAYVASHDLQEPLRMVTSFLTQLEKKYKHTLDEKALQYIHFAVDGSKRMRQIMLDLLEFSRVGKHHHELESISLNEVASECLILQKKLIEETGTQVEFKDLPTVFGNRTHLLQVFQNLITNGIKYRRDEIVPFIRISAVKEIQFWKISIEDNGQGIEEEYFEKIFVIFQRLHASKEKSGTGMGLAIVKKIIESSGGTIWVQSKIGVGSTFHFTIPYK